MVIILILAVPYHYAVWAAASPDILKALEYTMAVLIISSLVVPVTIGLFEFATMSTFVRRPED